MRSRITFRFFLLRTTIWEAKNGKIDMDSLQVLSRFEQFFVRQKAEEEKARVFTRVLKPWRKALKKACNQGLADAHICRTVVSWYLTRDDG